MIGTIANTALVIIGSLLGLLVKRGIPEKIKKTVMASLGIFTCIIGIKMGLEMQQPVVVLLSLVAGCIAGELLMIEDRLDRLGRTIRSLMKTRDEASFAQGFVSASLLFSVGPMTIIGCIQDGLLKKPELLLVKSLMDGIASTILASSYGAGVLFSALVVLVFQGTLTLLARQLQFLGSPAYLNDLSGVGGIIVFAIGIRLTAVKDIKAGNLIPALFLVLLFTYLMRFFN
jgi:uncharacterized membrane protein YqgA involved in biofilm formation